MTAIVDFQEFLIEARAGQPLHRLVLGQDSVRPVLSDWDPKTLQLTPQLTKARTIELAQKLGNQPQFTPPGLNLGAGTVAPGMGMNFTPHGPTGGEDK